MRVANFGADTAPIEEATFGFYGHDIRVAADASELAFIDFMEEFGTLDEDDPKGFKATKDLLRSFIHPDDFDLFWSTAKQNRQGIEQLITVVKTVVEAFAERPTGQPSGSVGGHVSTLPKSAGDSYSVVRSLIDREHPRADLANMVVLAQETMAGAG